MSKREQSKPSGVHDPNPRDREPTRPAVEPSMEPPDEAGALRPTERARVIDARVRPEAVPEPLVADPAVHLLLRRRHARQIARDRQVFVNRNLRMDRIEAIGFDMDYTLAIYHLRHLEELSFRLTVESLIRRKDYPEWLRELSYDPEFVIRGLVVDKRLGNIFKMDRHAHVGRVYHGRRQLTREERIRLYRQQKIDLRSDRYAWVDTLFALPEASLYADAVDRFDAEGGCDYARLYDDIRESIDLVHRDGTLKKIINQDLPHYIRRDPELGPTLHKLRSAGKKIFVLTNSYWSYTDRVMTYLLDGVLPEYPSWRNYFDVIGVGAQKPDFFNERRPFLVVDPETGEALHEAKALERGGVYQGGNLWSFEEWTGWTGDHVLYVGDHIYGDILRTKRSGLWRTAMVVQELEGEIAYIDRRAHEFQKLERLDDLRLRLDDEIIVQKGGLHDLEKRLEGKNGAAPDKHLRERLQAEWDLAKADLDRLRLALRDVLVRLEELALDLDRGANPHWGLLFKEDNENSRFGDQVEEYACLYTSRVSNLLYYSPTQYFRSRRDRMEHERSHRM